LFFDLIGNIVTYPIGERTKAWTLPGSWTCATLWNDRPAEGLTCPVSRVPFWVKASEKDIALRGEW